MARQKKESWGSRIGAIMAVAGSAVGLGNFLRFSGQVAQNGGGVKRILRGYNETRRLDIYFY